MNCAPPPRVRPSVTNLPAAVPLHGGAIDFPATKLGVPAMKRFVAVCCLAIVGVCVMTDTSSAQLFRRVWERRKAQIRSEVYGQVYGQVSRELNAKLDADLEQQVGEAKSELQQAAEQQVAAEADKLASQVKEDLIKLHEEAQKILRQEADKLAKLTAEELTKLRSEAVAKVEGEAKRLDDQVKEQVVQLKAENESKLKNTIASLNSAIEKALSDATAKLPDQVVAEVAKQTGQMKTEIMPELQQAVKAEIEALQKSAATETPEPAPVDPPQEQKQAAQTQPVRETEEQSAETPENGTDNSAE